MIDRSDLMKILAFSDMHGEDEFLDHLRMHLAINKYDAIVIAGDIEGSEYTEELLSILSGIKVFIVSGNMDSKGVIELLDKKGVLIDGRKQRLDGDWYIAGAGGSLPGPFHTPNERTETEIKIQLEKADIDEYTILLTHTPPYGIFDEPMPDVHIGSRSIREFILNKKPILNICGHVHEQQGQKMLGETLIVKLAPAKNMMVCIIDIDKSINVTFRSI